VKERLTQRDAIIPPRHFKKTRSEGSACGILAARQVNVMLQGCRDCA
jgi:hypothetical protein